MSQQSTPTEHHRAPDKHRASAAVIIFPLAMIAAAAFGALVPHVAGAVTPYVAWLLGFIMFTMGLTLTLPDLRVLRSRPWVVLLGVVLQYTIMPLTGLGVALLFNLDPVLVVGMVLLGCVPGGTASNIVTYLAGGNVALSVAMTAASTLIAPVMTPLTIMWLAGSYLPVDGAAMFQQILMIVLLPVLAGVLVQLFARGLVQQVVGVVPWLSILGVSLVLAGVLANSVEVIFTAGAAVYLAVVVHNAVGFGLGYLVAWAARISPRERRAISIEVGMQNSALAATLGGAHFGPLAAIPGAVAAVWHNVAGPLLALLFTRADHRTRPAAAHTTTSDGRPATAARL
ncbi:bile acid:sodium symporter family protein [Micrococcus sp.]|uniref:bile acid:sodium symporter family protein n=1 Tax=Micrococcus sp. TaxID=1271 RepID=UPI002A911360|nr:bile acid:sodium symporter family protein [Micrococcus sp.]MDY6054854.1 bile acid:sodium symporter family protein [Micrococcus sp.]